MSMNRCLISYIMIYDWENRWPIFIICSNTNLGNNISKICSLVPISQFASSKGRWLGHFYDRENEKINLCHCHYVRNNAMILKSPEMAPCASKPKLNLINNAKTSSFLHGAINSGQVSWGQFYNSTNSLCSFKNETNNISRSSKLDKIMDIFCIIPSVRTEDTSVWIQV